MDEDNKTPEQPANEHEYNMADSIPVGHRFDKIIGNQLTCTLHDSADCPVIFVKPTEVLVKGEDGTLHLYDKATEVA